MQNNNRIRWNIHTGSHSNQIAAPGKGIDVAGYQSTRRWVARVVVIVGIDVVVARPEYVVALVEIQLNIGGIKPAAGVDDDEFIQVFGKAGIDHNGFYLWALCQGAV